MKIIKILKDELNYGNKKFSLKLLYTLYMNPSKKAIFIYRVSKMLYDNKKRNLGLLFNNRLTTLFSSYISLNAEIGSNLVFRHISGVVIGEGVKIGNNVVIYQQVTLGGQKVGDGKIGNYPIIENNVTLFAGAKVLGAVVVGENSIVGANSVVIKDVPKNSVVAGAPAKVIRKIN